MTDQNTTIERIRSANPVPSPDSFPTGALSSARLLAHIDERNTDMTDTLTPIRSTEPGKPPPGNRGPLIALAVAAVLILVIGFTTFNVLTGDDTAPAVDPTTTTTTATETTVTTVTTVATTDPFVSSLPADTPPLEVLAALQAAWDSGDMAAADALIRPDSGFLAQNVSPGFAAELWYRNATGAVITDRDCRVETPAELANEGFEGTFVTCTETLESGINPGTEIGGGKLAVTVQDGWIVDVFILGYLGALDGERDGYQSYQNAYLSWMQERFPEDAEVLFDGIDMVIDTPEATAKHLDYIPFYLADTGPRDERALPADTPLLEVVDIFGERWDAGDVEGWEAIFHPLSGYKTGARAEQSWLAFVTGTTTARDCELVEPTLARCTEVISPGLVPGTTLDPVILEWNGAAGFLWSIDFPDGPPPGFENQLGLPGLTEYRDWVRDNNPGDFDRLFPDGLAMDLGTQELRNAHQDMVARYLAAIG